MFLVQPMGHKPTSWGKRERENMYMLLHVREQKELYKMENKRKENDLV